MKDAPDIGQGRRFFRSENDRWPSVETAKMIVVVRGLKQFTPQGRMRLGCAKIPAGNAHEAVEHETDGDHPHDSGRMLAESRTSGSHIALRP